jgi:hypothetical protein
MSDDIEFIPDSEFLSNLGRSAMISVPTMQAALAIAAEARANAPIDTGDYRDGIIAEQNGQSAKVRATDYKSAWIEFGTPGSDQPQPAHWVLRNAAEQLGYKFRRSQ